MRSVHSGAVEASKRQQCDYAVSRLFKPHAFTAEPQLHETEWLVEGLLPKGYLSIMARDPKVHKTCLATALGLAVATGIQPVTITRCASW